MVQRQTLTPNNKQKGKAQVTTYREQVNIGSWLLISASNVLDNFIGNLSLIAHHTCKYCYSQLQRWQSMKFTRVLSVHAYHEYKRFACNTDRTFLKTSGRMQSGDQNHDHRQTELKMLRIHERRYYTVLFVLSSGKYNLLLLWNVTDLIEVGWCDLW